MRVYGVDLGTRRISVACPALDLVWSTDLTVGQGAAARKRQFPGEFEAGMELGRLTYVMLNDFFQGDHGDGEDLFDVENVFFVERPFVGSKVMNIRTAIGQSLSAGAALATLPGKVVVLDSPSLWKKALCGRGNASKDEIREWIEGRHPALAEACRGIEDRFDAVGIALGSAQLAQAGDL